MITDPLAHRVAPVCRDLLPAGARVLVAVSGGGDSLALLHLLVTLAPASGWRLALAHINHRQDPSIDDLAVAMLQQQADQLGLPLLTAEADLPPEAAEAALRQARYAFLAETAREWGASHVAVAHHADDQAETLLLRLLRGAVGGLGGMRPARPLDGQSPVVTVVRPLLGFTRAELEAYGQRHGLQPIADPSNANPRFRRNRIRHDLLPRLERDWPGSGTVLARTAGWLQEDDDWLQTLAAAVVAELPPGDLSVATLQAQPGPIRRRVLRQILAERGLPGLDSTALASLEGVIAGEIPGTMLPGGWQARRHGGRLSFGLAATTAARPAAIPFYPTAGSVALPGWPYRVTVRPATAADGETAWQIRLPTRDLPDSLHWRQVQAGDRLATAPGRQKVGELLRQQGLSPHSRRSQLVLADDTGVVWVVGIRRGNRFKAPAAGDSAWLVHVARTEQPDC